MKVVLREVFVIILHSICLDAGSLASDIYTGTTFAVSFPKVSWIQTMCITVTPVGKAPLEIRVIDVQTRAVTLNGTITHAVQLNYSQIVDGVVSEKGYIINSSDSILATLTIPATNHSFYSTSLLPVTSWGNESAVCSSNSGAPKELIITKIDGNSFDTTFINLSDVLAAQSGVIELHQRENNSGRYFCYCVLSEKPALVTSVLENSLSVRPPVRSWGKKFLLFSLTNTLHVILNGNSSNNTVHTSSTSSSNVSVAVLQQYERADLYTSPNTLVSIVSSQPSSVTTVDYDVDERVPNIDQYGNCYSFTTDETGRTVLVIAREETSHSLFLNHNRIKNFNRKSSVKLSETPYVVLKIVVANGRHQISSDTTKFAVLNPAGKFLPGITNTTCAFIQPPADITQSVSNDNQVPLFASQNNQNIRLDETTPDTSSDGEAMSPAVMAIIISMSCAVCLVVLCIIGFIIAELCRRRGGDHRNAKVTPYTA